MINYIMKNFNDINFIDEEMEQDSNMWRRKGRMKSKPS